MSKLAKDGCTDGMLFQSKRSGLLSISEHDLANTSIHIWGSGQCVVLLHAFDSARDPKIRKFDLTPMRPYNFITNKV
jgi:hypothetical protein